MKQYYELTREQQNERKTERIECDICHNLYSRTNLQHHEKVAHDADTTYRDKISSMKRDNYLVYIAINSLQDTIWLTT